MKWIDAWFAMERIFDSRWYGWYRCYDDVYCLRRPLAAHAG